MNIQLVKSAVFLFIVSTIIFHTPTILYGFQQLRIDAGAFSVIFYYSILLLLLISLGFILVSLLIKEEFTSDLVLSIALLFLIGAYGILTGSRWGVGIIIGASIVYVSRYLPILYMSHIGVAIATISLYQTIPNLSITPLSGVLEMALVLATVATAAVPLQNKFKAYLYSAFAAILASGLIYLAIFTEYSISTLDMLFRNIAIILYIPTSILILFSIISNYIRSKEAQDQRKNVRPIEDDAVPYS